MGYSGASYRKVPGTGGHTSPRSGPKCYYSGRTSATPNHATGSPGKQFLEPGPDPILGAARPENSATMLQMCSPGETSNRLRELMFRALDEDTRSRRLPFTGMKLAFLLFQHGIFYLLIAVAPTVVSSRSGPAALLRKRQFSLR